MQPCAGEQIQNSLHTLTVVRRRNFAENDAERRLRVENVAVILFMRSYFDNSMKQMLRTGFFRDDLLTVHAVHQTHDHRMLACYFLYTLQSTRQCAVFERDDQKIHAVCLFRCPYLRVINRIVNFASFVFQTLRPFPGRDNAKPDVLFLRKPPDHIRPNRSGAQNSN